MADHESPDQASLASLRRPVPAVIADVALLVRSVPETLKSLPQWVCWQYVIRDKRWTKRPLQAMHRGEPKAASATHPSTWTSFAQACQVLDARRRDFAGVGFVMTARDPYTGIDLDRCIVDGQIQPWAQAFIDSLSSYTEMSPSGCGVKILVEAKKPGERCKAPYCDGAVEVYDHDRYFTLTGAQIEGTPGTIAPRQQALVSLYQQVFPATTKQRPPSRWRANSHDTTLADEQIIHLARRFNAPKFTRLWAGDCGGFPSSSEADSSLMCILAFYSRDETQLDRLYRRSGLYRPKWDERRGHRTYGAATIAATLSFVSERWVGTSSLSSGRTEPARAIIVGNVQLAEMTTESMDALEAANDPPKILLYGNRWCRVRETAVGTTQIETLDRNRLRSRLCEVARFYIRRKNSRQSVAPPASLVENLLAQERCPFPVLRGITHVPILREDGTHYRDAGYDHCSQLWYVPIPGVIIPPVPAAPTTLQVAAALTALKRVIADFPFADRASPAHALSLLLTLLMRPLIDGNVPLLAIAAPTAGTGKTLLASAMALVALPEVAVESIPARNTDDEWRKKVTSILTAGTPMVLLDNLPDHTALDAAPLAAALTSENWSERHLGRITRVQAPSRAVWVVTGNNLRVTGDLVRRTVFIRLDANVARPWHRSGFAIDNLLRFVRQSRGELLAAALTIVSGWYAAGAPVVHLPTLGGFDQWVRLVGSVLAFAGVEHFLANVLPEDQPVDEETRQWTVFFDAWNTAVSQAIVTVDALITRLKALVCYRSVLPDVLAPSFLEGDDSLKRSLGRQLARLNGRIFGEWKLVAHSSDPRTKVRRWQVRRVDNPVNPATNPVA